MATSWAEKRSFGPGSWSLVPMEERIGMNEPPAGFMSTSVGFDSTTATGGPRVWADLAMSPNQLVWLAGGGMLPASMGLVLADPDTTFIFPDFLVKGSSPASSKLDERATPPRKV